MYLIGGMVSPPFLYQFENYWDLLCNYDLWASYLCSRSRSHFGLPYIFPPIQVLTTWTTCGGLRSNSRSRSLELQALRLVLAQVLLRMTMMTFLSLSLERHLRRLLKRKRSRHNFAACLLLWRVYKSNIAITKDILLRPLTYLICACGPVLSCTRIWSDVLVGFHMKYASFWYPYSRCFVCFYRVRASIIVGSPSCRCSDVWFEVLLMGTGQPWFHDWWRWDAISSVLLSFMYLGCWKLHLVSCFHPLSLSGSLSRTCFV